MSDIPVSDRWHRLMRLPKGIFCLTVARDPTKNIELQIMATQADWERYQRLDKELEISQEWFEKKMLSSDLTVTEVLDLLEAERKERAEKVSPP